MTIAVRDFTNGSDVIADARRIKDAFFPPRQNAPTRVPTPTEVAVSGLLVAVETLNEQMGSRITHAEFSEEVAGLKSALVAVQAELALINRLLSEDVKTAENVRLAKRRGSMAPILGAVLEEFFVSRNDLCSGRRSRTLVRARFAFMYLARTHTSRSYPEIGRFLGGRDHTTVMYGCERVQEMMSTDNGFRASIRAIEARLDLGGEQ